MPLSIIPLTNKQALTGSFVSVEAAILAVTPLIAHTCPAGIKQKVKPTYSLVAWGGAGRNLRLRVAGVLIQQIDDTNHPVPQPAFQFGEFILNPGETISVTTQNAGTEGGTMRCSVSILEQSPA